MVRCEPRVRAALDRDDRRAHDAMPHRSCPRGPAIPCPRSHDRPAPPSTVATTAGAAGGDPRGHRPPDGRGDVGDPGARIEPGIVFAADSAENPVLFLGSTFDRSGCQSVPLAIGSGLNVYCTTGPQPPRPTTAHRSSPCTPRGIRRGRVHGSHAAVAALAGGDRGRQGSAGEAAAGSRHVRHADVRLHVLQMRRTARSSCGSTPTAPGADQRLPHPLTSDDESPDRH